jgi:hypothetical protein
MPPACHTEPALLVRAALYWRALTARDPVALLPVGGPGFVPYNNGQLRTCAVEAREWRWAASGPRTSGYSRSTVTSG